jgi:hypothetical protein
MHISYSCFTPCTKMSLYLLTQHNTWHALPTKHKSALNISDLVFKCTDKVGQCIFCVTFFQRDLFSATVKMICKLLLFVAFQSSSWSKTLKELEQDGQLVSKLKMQYFSPFIFQQQLEHEPINKCLTHKLCFNQKFRSVCSVRLLSCSVVHSP